YLALSYVWGGDQAHKTTTSNLSAYEHGIPPSLLPATIRDAIRLTHLLGFCALWVDSLCIVQDSDEDKHHEIRRMHDVYRYAHLTIVAASAERANAGFLYKRPPQDGDFAIPFICPPHPPLYHTVLGRMATRSWCMQEYLLSPRSLIVTPRTVLFRCRVTMEAVGNSPEGINSDPRLPDALFLAVPPAVQPRSKEWRDIHAAWLRIIQNYSTRTASDETDKLVACAAIAELFHRALRSDYLAGLWRTDALLIDLLWTPWGNKRRVCALPTAYRSPSWSWAAVEGPIMHLSWITLEDPRNIALAEITQCWVTLEDPALPFGRVTDGTLVLHGM
ncbi:HET-domain-containing protein, partial [Trametes versicolor FP-101664 SS1]|uniref:HET-domain-containing protein n=1 Tax=Trametes versicolor (strain FP-101664) TaxID=717944 RepID=UPI0004622763